MISHPSKKALLRTEQGQLRNTCAIHHMVRTIAHKTSAFAGPSKFSYGKANLELLKGFSAISKDHSLSRNHHQLNHIPIHFTPHRFKLNWQNYAALRHTKVMHKNILYGVLQAIKMTHQCTGPRGLSMHAVCCRGSVKSTRIGTAIYPLLPLSRFLVATTYVLGKSCFEV